MCIQNNDGNMDLFVSFIQLMSETTVMTLESTALDLYSVRNIILVVSARSCQLLICNFHTLIGFLPGFYTQEQLKEKERGG